MLVSLNYGYDSMELDIPLKNYMITLNPKDIKQVDNPILIKRFNKKTFIFLQIK